MATESKGGGYWSTPMQPSVDADGNPLKKAPAKPPKKQESVKSVDSGGARSGGGGGGMNPADIEKVKKPGALKMKKGGAVSASKRADGIAIRGKTKGRMV